MTGKDICPSSSVYSTFSLHSP